MATGNSAGDTRDASGNDRHAVNHGVKWDADGNAVFDGRNGWLEVPARQMPAMGTGSFSVAAWVHTEQQLDDVLGDVMTCYDPQSRNGFTLRPDELRRRDQCPVELAQHPLWN